MKKLFVLGTAGVLFALAGCSRNSQKGVTQSAPPAVQTAVMPTSMSPVTEPLALPVPSAEQANHQGWRTENIKDRFINGMELMTTSLDGKYDMVILREGRQSFLSFAKHGHWESVHHLAAKGKLMILRAKFEDGQEKYIEWDELGFGTENLYGVLWSYPAKKDAPIGPVQAASNDDSFGGDHLLIGDMIKHKTMLLEVAPVVTAQFDLTGLAQEIEKTHTKAQPVLSAMQNAE